MRAEKAAVSRSSSSAGSSLPSPVASRSRSATSSRSWSEALSAERLAIVLRLPPGRDGSKQSGLGIEVDSHSGGMGGSSAQDESIKPVAEASPAQLAVPSPGVVAGQRLSDS